MIWKVICDNLPELTQPAYYRVLQLCDTCDQDEAFNLIREQGINSNLVNSNLQRNFVLLGGSWHLLGSQVNLLQELQYHLSSLDGKMVEGHDWYHTTESPRMVVQPFSLAELVTKELQSLWSRMNIEQRRVFKEIEERRAHGIRLIKKLSSGEVATVMRFRGSRVVRVHRALGERHRQSSYFRHGTGDVGDVIETRSQPHSSESGFE